MRAPCRTPADPHRNHKSASPGIFTVEETARTPEGRGRLTLGLLSPFSSLPTSSTCASGHCTQKMLSIIALRILEFKRSNSDVWAQKSPPEGDACFSASSTQGLLGRRQRPRQRLLPVLQFLPPWKFQAPARQEKEASRAPGFQEASMRGAQGREGQDQ